jgi:hypothetical protein
VICFEYICVALFTSVVALVFVLFSDIFVIFLTFGLTILCSLAMLKTEYVATNYVFKF